MALMCYTKAMVQRKNRVADVQFSRLRSGLGWRLHYTLRLAGWSHGDVMLDTAALLAWLLAALERQGRDHACLAAVVPLLQLCMLVRHHYEAVCQPRISSPALSYALPAATCASVTPGTGCWYWGATAHEQQPYHNLRAALVAHG